MQFLKLILRNGLRHKLRTGLTVLGLVVAILAFGLLQTVVDAWYVGANSAAPNRLVTRNAISLTFPMPLHYRDKIRAVDGVRAVGAANWFGGIYQDPKNFFPQFAIDPAPYFAMYPEYRLKEDELRAFLRDRKGAVIGRKLAATYGFRIGDTIPLQGTIFPGTWSFTVRGIYDGAETKTDTSQMFFHWDYVNEVIKSKIPRRADQVGVFVVQIDDPARSAEISHAIDRQFVNSLAETLTETEKAFQLGFVAMTEAIVVAIRIVSFVVIFIILAVMANTMAMTARERLGEYATLKALGFAPGYVAWLVLGESVAIAIVGAGLGIAATFPVSAAFAAKVGTLFPVFEVSGGTVALQAGCAIAVGVAAALLPGRRAARVKIVEGLRAIG
ncbi:MAG TPA: FtsX-like permease family protein [Burkholderiales bacterium]|nr:FtsX-like permease family protein [Burkholderiales bacterium]